MTDHYDRLKLGVLNIIAWIGAGISLQHVQAFVAIAGGLGSLAVSITTIWWIKKQARDHDRKGK